jgi:hypothetical protein
VGVHITPGAYLEATDAFVRPSARHDLDTGEVDVSRASRSSAGRQPVVSPLYSVARPAFVVLHQKKKEIADWEYQVDTNVR